LQIKKLHFIFAADIFLIQIIFKNQVTMENRISFSLNESDKKDILNAIEVLNTKLLPHLIELGHGEVRELPVMGDKSYAFVTKTLEFAKQYPEFAALINMPEFEKDVISVSALREFSVPLAQLTKKAQDTITLAGSEAYVSALTYYGSAREGKKRKLPNAILITDELGKRFPQRPHAHKNTSEE